MSAPHDQNAPPARAESDDDVVDGELVDDGSETLAARDDRTNAGGHPYPGV